MLFHMLSILFYSLTSYTLFLHLTAVNILYNTPRRTAPAISHLPIRTSHVLTYASRHPWSPSHNSNSQNHSRRAAYDKDETWERTNPFPPIFSTNKYGAPHSPAIPRKSTNNYGGTLPFWFWHDIITPIFLGVWGHGDTMTKYPRKVESTGCGKAQPLLHLPIWTVPFHTYDSCHPWLPYHNSNSQHHCWRAAHDKDETRDRTHTFPSIISTNKYGGPHSPAIPQ